MDKPEVIDSVKVCGNCQRWVMPDAEDDETLVETCCLTKKNKSPHEPGCEQHSLICYLDPKWYGIETLKTDS